MNWPLEQEGSTGENVRSVQYLLDAHGAALAVDGIFGPQTAGAMRAFQRSHNLKVDAIVGNATWPALIIEVASGSSGDAVRGVQSQISVRANGWVTINGVFDPETDNVVRSFQGDIGLSADGIVGPKTWNAFATGYLISQGAQAGIDFYNAWTHNDRATARKSGTPAAVDALFARTWQASDGWTFVGTEGAAGHLFDTWSRFSGDQLSVRINDNAAPFYFVENVQFQP